MLTILVQTEDKKTHLGRRPLTPPIFTVIIPTVQVQQHVLLPSTLRCVALWWSVYPQTGRCLHHSPDQSVLHAIFQKVTQEVEERKRLSPPPLLSRKQSDVTSCSFIYRPSKQTGFILKTQTLWMEAAAARTHLPLGFHGNGKRAELWRSLD